MNSQILENKYILLFSQYFFGYENKIKRKMEEMGAKVDLFDEMSVKSMFDRALLKVSSELFVKKTEIYYTDILKKIKDKKYDYILFIDCETPTEGILKIFKDNFRQAKFCLHMWDSISNLKGVSLKFKYFDYITTFDRNDAEEYGITLRPLFFCDEYRANNINDNCEYDLSFIGTIHSDRYGVLKKIIDNTDKMSLKMFFYPFLQSKFIYYFYKVTKKDFKNAGIKDFKFDKLSSDDIANVIKKTRTIIDIQHPKQSGLTMRTLEIVGMKKKIITTNSDIVNYDFYNENNIAIIDRKSPLIDKNFINSPYVELDLAIYEYYSIKKWCLDVLGV